MSKNKYFDIDTVKLDTMHLFRRKGFASTSIKDIEKVTGLKAGSFYHSFSSKRDMFFLIFDHYLEKVVKKRIDLYLRGEDPIEGIRSLFLSTFENDLGDNRGCLLTNIAVEIGALDQDCQEKVAKGLRLYEKAFEKSIIRAQELGQVRRGKDAKSIARHLNLSYQGILVLVKVTENRKILRAHTDSTISMIT